MKTKSTVARRRVKRRQERVSHKKLRTLRSRKYARKTARKVMRGGGKGVVFGERHGSIAADYADDDDDEPEHSKTNKGIQGFSALLYDNIPLSTSSNKEYNIPICVFFIKKRYIVDDDVYIFFNKNVTADEIRLIVQHYLGVNDIIISPDIQIKSSDHSSEEKLDKLWGFLGDTFVKLSGCGTRRNYCLETGVFSNETPLFEITLQKHTMKYSDEKPVEIKTRKKDDIVMLFKGGGDFTKKIPNMTTTVQPTLFQKYIKTLKNKQMLVWESYDINKQKIQQSNYKGIPDYRPIVYGEDRQLKLTYSDTYYSDKFTPKFIVINIQNGLEQLSMFKILENFSEQEIEAEAEAAVMLMK